MDWKLKYAGVRWVLLSNKQKLHPAFVVFGGYYFGDSTELIFWNLSHHSVVNKQPYVRLCVLIIIGLEFLLQSWSRTAVAPVSSMAQLYLPS